MSGTDRFARGLRVAAGGAIAVTLAALAVAGAPRPLVAGRPAPRRRSAPAAAAPTEAQFQTALDRARLLLARATRRAGRRRSTTRSPSTARRTTSARSAPTSRTSSSRLAFRIECPPPDPATLVKGKLKKFVSKTGDLEIRYAAGKPHDFESVAGSLAFPARFRARTRSRSRARRTRLRRRPSRRCSVGARGGPEDAPRAGVGRHPGVPAVRPRGNRKHWLPARIVADRRRGHEGRRREGDVAREGRATPWRLEGPGDARRASPARSTTTSIGSAPKPDGVFGYAPVQPRTGPRSSSRARSSPRGSRAKHRRDRRRAKRAAFDAKFDVKERLPAWLYEAARASKAPGATRRGPARRRGRGCPPQFRLQVLARAARSCCSTEDAGGAAGGRERCARTERPTVADAARSPRARTSAIDEAQARSPRPTALAAEPDGLDALLLKADVLLWLGREDEARRAVGRRGGREAGARRASRRGGRCRSCMAGRLDDARGGDRGGRAPRLARRSSTRSAASSCRRQNGPTWPKTYEYKSDELPRRCPTSTSRRAAQAADDPRGGARAYRVHVNALEARRRRALYKRLPLRRARPASRATSADVAVLLRPRAGARRRPLQPAS